MREDALLAGRHDLTSDWNVIAKLVAIRTCQANSLQYVLNVISLKPTKLYVPRDNFNLPNANLTQVLIRRFHEATVRSDAEVKILVRVSGSASS